MQVPYFCASAAWAAQTVHAPPQVSQHHGPHMHLICAYADRAGLQDLSQAEPGSFFTSQSMSGRSQLALPLPPSTIRARQLTAAGVHKVVICPAWTGRCWSSGIPSLRGQRAFKYNPCWAAHSCRRAQGGSTGTAASTRAGAQRTMNARSGAGRAWQG